MIFQKNSHRKFLLRVCTLVPIMIFSRAWAWAPIQKNSTDFYFQLAQYHAPVVYQQVGGDPVADANLSAAFSNARASSCCDEA